MDTLNSLHLIEVELQTKYALDLDREVAKDEEGSVTVVGVLEAVKGGYQSPC